MHAIECIASLATATAKIPRKKVQRSTEHNACGNVAEQLHENGRGLCSVQIIDFCWANIFIALMERNNIHTKYCAMAIDPANVV